jgi:tricorn protease
MIVRALVAVVFALPGLSHGQTRLLRQPSYANGKVAFSYFGSIWVANDDGTNLQRLTVNKARDEFPRFSPDGKWIAFSSNRQGNYDVYVIPAEGGKPKQLTFHSADDHVVGWTPDGKKIIFTSSRGQGVFPGVTTLFEIPADGGMEQPIPTDWGSWASYSPDGSKLAFSRHPGVWSRKHYRGSYSVDLWLMDVASGQFTKLNDGDYKGNYYWPMFGHDGSIYFVADRTEDERDLKFGSPEVMKSVNNIWKMPASGGTPVQVTHQTDGDLFFPSMSADGKTIVYEDNFLIWKLDLESGQSTQIPISINSDTKENDTDLRVIQSECESFSLSPSGKRAAIATHGEIFTVATDRGEEQRVTETPWREADPVWSPDGKWIAFISDRTGRQEIWISDELGKKIKQLSDADCEKNSLIWAPNAKSLLWTGSDHTLRQVDIGSGETKELASSNVAPIGSVELSPDGKWLSYSKEDALLRSRLYVRSMDGGPEHIIDSDQFISAQGAKWTSDGKKLVFLGGVGAPAMSALNRTTYQLYSVALTHVSKDPNDKDIDTEAQATSQPANAGRGGGRRGRGRGAPDAGGDGTDGSDASSKPEVKIEWDGLERRITQLTRLGSGSVVTVVPSPDSRTYAFVAFGADDTGGGFGGGPAIYTIADDGTRMTRVNTAPAADTSGATPRRGRGGRGGFGGGGEPQWSKDGRSLYFLQGGGIYSVAIAVGGGGDSSTPSPAAGGFGRRGRGFGGRGAATPSDTGSAGGATPTRVNFTVRIEVDRAAERRQVFEEAWRIMKSRFYDKNMHGADWNAAKETYGKLLSNVDNTEELHNVIMEMIGELNASHTGISGGEAPGDLADRIQTRYPGFDVAADESSGYYKVAKMYRHGPADHEYIKLKTGDYVLSVNGRELKSTENLWRLLNLVTGRKFEFRVNDKPEMEGAWTVAIEPISGMEQSNLEYEAWVDARREMVNKLSDRQIGYLHIKAMDAPSLTRFQRDLLDNLDKKALIIDERFNGGGGIDQELLAILSQRKKYESYRGRDSVELPRPVQAFFGPMAVLQNERSASNAEMFPEGFRTLGLGKVIGMPTYGAVIGTGAYRLLDGSTIRTPSYGVFTAKGISFENYGVQPDVMIDNTPADFLTGHDRQIEKAVEVLKGEIGVVGQVP